MGLTERVLDTILDGSVVEVNLGLHWTAVVVDVDGDRRCGLASTFTGKRRHGGGPAVPQAGELRSLSGRALAGFALADEPERATLGVAAINALLPREPQAWHEGNAEDLLKRLGNGKRTALIGHFPFVPRLRQTLDQLDVIDRNPREGDFPEAAAPDVLAKAEVVAITGMTFVNHSLEGLLALCPPEALVMVLGPSSPLSRALFHFSVDLISGSIVTEIEPVLRTISEGGNFRQVHHAGVRLVTLARPEVEPKLA